MLHFNIPIVELLANDLLHFKSLIVFGDALFYQMSRKHFAHKEINKQTNGTMSLIHGVLYTGHANVNDCMEATLNFLHHAIQNKH